MTAWRDVADAEDVYRDFCLWEYRRQAPAEGKPRSAELLRQSFADVELGDRGERLCATLRDRIGPFRTVWGIKWDSLEVTWELYFYDYARRRREVSLDLVRSTLDGLVALPSNAKVLGDPPYFMCSVEFDAAALAGEKTASEVSIYVDDAGFDGNSGRSYRLTADGPMLRNTYYFVERATGMRRVHDLVASSMHLGAAADRLAAWTGRYRGSDGAMIVVASKAWTDGLYYTRIGCDSLATFMADLGFPKTLLGLLERADRPFDHLLFDIGFDVQLSASGPEVRKGAIYGVL